MKCEVSTFRYTLQFFLFEFSITLPLTEFRPAIYIYSDFLRKFVLIFGKLKNAVTSLGIIPPINGFRHIASISYATAEYTFVFEFSIPIGNCDTYTSHFIFNSLKLLVQLMHMFCNINL
jgi:hypothetical protein